MQSENQNAQIDPTTPPPPPPPPPADTQTATPGEDDTSDIKQETQTK